MGKIEAEFADLKVCVVLFVIYPLFLRVHRSPEAHLLQEKYFSDKKKAIRHEIELVDTGKHEQYIAKEKLLQKKLEAALEAAAKERTYQIRNAQLVYEAELAQAQKDFQLDRKHLKKKMKDALHRRIDELREEKKTISLADVKRKEQENRQQSSGSRRKKAKQDILPENFETRKRRINPPHVNYHLREGEIYSDIHLIRRGPYPRAQLENILYDVYAVGNDAVVYYEKQFEVGQACVVTDEQGKPQYSGVIEMVSPIEVKVQAKQGETKSIEMAKLRDGNLCLVKP